MMRRPRSKLLTLLAGLLLTACGGPLRDRLDTGNTIADLQAAKVSPATRLSGDARDKAISAYQDYLQRYPASAESDRISRRVADLLLARAGDSMAAVSVSAEQSAAAQRDYAEAIDLYQQLLAGAPGSLESAQLRYQLARAYEESGQTAQATHALQQLVRQEQVAADPKLYADAQFRRGELLFSAGEYGSAERAYRAVLGLGRSVPVYAQARYKLGWALYNQARYADALSVFTDLIEEKLQADTSPDTYLATLSRADQEQMDDVFRGISLCFSHLGGADAVETHFRQRGQRRYATRVYRDLAGLYVEKGFYSDAAETLRAQAGQDPLSPGSADLSIQVVELYRHAGLLQQELLARAALVEEYGLNPAYLERHPLSSQPALRQEIQISLIDLAQQHHSSALKGGGEAAFENAERWYRSYLRLFPEAAQAPRMNLGLAGLYYDRGQYAQAAAEYERTAFSYGEHALTGRAGRSALEAHQRRVATMAPERREPAALAAAAGALRFVDRFPDDPEAPAVLAEAGTELLQQGQLEQVVTYNEQLLQRAGLPPPLQGVAWSLIGQASFKAGEYATAEQAYRQALVTVPVTSPGYPALQQGVTASLYKLAQQQRSQGDRSASSKLFLRAAEESAEPDMRARARYDAGADLLALEQWAQAVGVLKRFVADHADHPLQQQARRKLAYAYERAGRPKAAAAEYLRLTGGDGGDRTLEREALLRAAALQRQAGDGGTAIRTLERYLSEHPQPPILLVEVHRQLAQLHREAGNTAQRYLALSNLVAAHRAAGPEADDSSTRLAAAASLELADRRSAEFRRIALVEPLDKSLSAKLGVLQSAIEAYEAAKAYQRKAVVTAANFQVAEMYRELGMALLASERPRDLNPLEDEQYERLLREQAEPFREKAIKIHQGNLRLMSGGYYDQWIDRSLQQLARSWPERYARNERGESLVAGQQADRGRQSIGWKRTHQQALALMRDRQYSEAEQVWKAALESEPGHPLAALNLAIAYGQQGKLSEAGGMLRRLLRDNPGNSIAYNELGVIERRSGQLREAEDAYRKAIRLRPDYALPHWNMGVLCDLYQQDADCAMHHYRSYRRLATDSDGVDLWIADLVKRYPDRRWERRGE